MAVSTDAIKNLREKTGVSVMECQRALEEANGNAEEAVKALKKRFGAMASRKAERETKAGIIDAYLHPNAKIGVMLELFAETDFVAKHEDFKKLAHEIALHIAAMDPLFRARADVPAATLESYKREIAEEVLGLNKSPEIAENIIAGKLAARLEEQSLFDQPFVKDPSKKVSDVVNEAVGKFGENIRVGKFARFAI